MTPSAAVYAPARLPIEEAVAGLAGVDADAVLAETRHNQYDGITATELAQARAGMGLNASRSWVGEPTRPLR